MIPPQRGRQRQIQTCTSDANAVKLSTTFLNSVLPVQRPRIVAELVMAL